MSKCAELLAKRSGGVMSSRDGSGSTKYGDSGRRMLDDGAGRCGVGEKRDDSPLPSETKGERESCCPRLVGLGFCDDDGLEKTLGVLGVTSTVSLFLGSVGDPVFITWGGRVVCSRARC